MILVDLVTRVGSMGYISKSIDNFKKEYNVQVFMHQIT